MFTCGVCKHLIGPGVNIGGRVPVKTRLKTYPFRRNAFRIRDHETNKMRWVDDPGGSGWEIVREILVCNDCIKED